ncbi:unnamed protein product [Cuscuta epithymum]|uniref:Fiber protein Fb34 n=1 Tax=Cuscuta epithymum TaxID=186058 RepID=A0AAV0CQU4_9ASTE|nr:unnamed protein product [Cuscuta epithymum]
MSQLLMIIVSVLDSVAFALAVAAEQRRSTAQIGYDIEETRKYCIYDSDIATGYGVGAMLFLLAGQILVMFVSSCFCCGKALKQGGSRACAILLFIFGWVTFAVAEVCLLAGSVRNAYHTKYTSSFLMDDKPLFCQTLRKGVFAAGAAFIVITGFISHCYYAAYSVARSAPAGPHNRSPSIGMTRI